jgi:hypothetical protein
MNIAMPAAGAAPLLGGLLAPGIPWQAPVTVAVLGMFLVLVRDLVTEVNRHREIVLVTNLAAPGASMNDVVPAIVAIRPPTNGTAATGT